jgi:hypothetical protein
MTIFLVKSNSSCLILFLFPLQRTGKFPIYYYNNKRRKGSMVGSSVGPFLTSKIVNLVISPMWDKTSINLTGCFCFLAQLIVYVGLLCPRLITMFGLAMRPTPVCSRSIPSCVVSFCLRDCVVTDRSKQSIQSQTEPLS